MSLWCSLDFYCGVSQLHPSDTKDGDTCSPNVYFGEITSLNHWPGRGHRVDIPHQNITDWWVTKQIDWHEVWPTIAVDMTWARFAHYCTIERGIRLSLMYSLTKEYRALRFALLLCQTSCWINSWGAGRRSGMSWHSSVFTTVTIQPVNFIHTDQGIQCLDSWRVT